jgi:hypothetical protein
MRQSDLLSARSTRPKAPLPSSRLNLNEDSLENGDRTTAASAASAAAAAPRAAASAAAFVVASWSKLWSWSPGSEGGEWWTYRWSEVLC